MRFSHDSLKLAMVQSDHIAFVYKFAPHKEHGKKSICNKFSQQVPVQTTKLDNKQCYQIFLRGSGAFLRFFFQGCHFWPKNNEKKNISL